MAKSSIRSVIIARVADGLPLCAVMDNDEDLDSEFPEHKSQFKALIKSLSTQLEPLCSLESKDGAFFFHVMLASSIGFICLCDKSYPKKLAFSFLNDLHKNFAEEYTLGQVDATTRPYAFIKFEGTVNRLCKSFQDARARENMKRLHDELTDISQVMTSNIQQVLERGNKLEHMSLLSETLSADSKRYMRDTRYLNIMAMYQKYGPLVLVISIVLFLTYIYIRFLR
jgi:vesicle transport protein SEC22